MTLNLPISIVGILLRQLTYFISTVSKVLLLTLLKQKNSFQGGFV